MATRRRHSDEVVATIRDQDEVGQFTSARQLLRQHLLCVREIPNGRDFLFSGSLEQIQEALRRLVQIEHKYSRFLQFDHAQVEEYFLLRIVGLPDHEEVIQTYFEGE